MGTIVVLAVLIVVVALAVRSLYKDKKAGKSIQCGVGCSHCAGNCHQAQGMQENQEGDAK